MKSFLIFCFGFVVLNTGCSNSSGGMIFSPLTKAKIQGLNDSSGRHEKLKEETISGCISVPAKSFFQRIFVGSESTGESCSVTIHPGNKVSVSFLDQKNIQLISTSSPQVVTDTFVAELDNGEVLVVQQVEGRVVSLTQTVYDSQGRVVYQNSGKGDYIRECRFYMTISEKAAGRCQKTP